MKTTDLLVHDGRGILEREHREWKGIAGYASSTATQRASPARVGHVDAHDAAIAGAAEDAWNEEAARNRDAVGEDGKEVEEDEENSQRAHRELVVCNG